MKTSTFDRQSVNYLISGPAHLPNLVVSISALRAEAKYYGRVYVHTWPESVEYVKQICDDPILEAEMIVREPEYRGKNDQFLDKIRMMQMAPTEIALYLDADTMPVKTIYPLFSYAEQDEFTATRFNDWFSNGGIIRKRLKRLIDREPIDQEAVQRVLHEPWPSVNGGVFACTRDCEVLKTWEQWTVAVKDIFIADETVLHALLPIYFGQGMCVAGHNLAGCYNSSPKHKAKSTPDDAVKIWHFHGDSNLRPNKSQKGVDLWWPRYQLCLQGNIGNLAEWKDDIGSKYLPKLEASKQNDDH